MVVCALVWLWNPVWAEPPPTPLPSVPGFCVPLPTAQASAGVNPYYWQQLYSTCLAEVMRLRAQQVDPTAKPFPGSVGKAVPPVLLPTY